MNIENLKRMEQRLRTVPDIQFGMGTFREDFTSEYNTECRSVACVIGWCTDLDSENIRKRFIKDDCTIDFAKWSTSFTQIGMSKSNIWYYLFSSHWERYDNSVTGARKRLLHVIDLYEKGKDLNYINGFFASVVYWIQNNIETPRHPSDYYKEYELN